MGVSLPEPATTGPVAVNVNSATATTSAASMTGKVDGNTIGTQGATDSGAKQGNGIRGWIQGQSVGVLGIYNNQIREVPNASPITVFGRTGTGSARFKVTGNVMPRPTGTNFDVGCAAPTTTPTPCPTNTVSAQSLKGFKVCAVVSGNSAYDPESWPQGAGNNAFFLFHHVLAGSAFNLEGNTAQSPVRTSRRRTTRSPTARVPAPTCSRAA